jgi:predicted HTH transcriptional regulator
MNNFYDKAEYNFQDIMSLIENEIEESIHLDFKEANALEKSDGKKKEISKDVSAFANSDGGIIIYGIKEQNHKAHSLTYINGQDFTKEWLEQTINSSIQRRIPDLKIFVIRNSGNIHETIYIVKIPKSFEAPHLCKDKRFYKRFNFESVAMEEYEVRQLYGQKLRSKLAIAGHGIYKLKDEAGYDDEEGKTTFMMEVLITNEGDVSKNTGSRKTRTRKRCFS